MQPIKRTLTLILLAAMALALPVTLKAQTNAPGSNTTVAATAPAAATTMPVITELENAGKDLLADIESMRVFTTNGNATLRTAVGMNTSTRSFLEFASLELPVSKSVSVGFMGGHKGNQWYEGAISVSYGVTNNWPVLGLVRSYAGTGVGYDFANRNPVSYSFIGFEKNWKLSERWDAGASVGIAKTSDQAGEDPYIGAHVTYYWQARSAAKGTASNSYHSSYELADR